MAINVKVVEAPNAIYSVSERFSLKIFIAGGISGCRDWQSELIHSIQDAYEVRSPDYDFPFKYPEVTLYNPRRKEFNIYDSSMEDEQAEIARKQCESAKIDMTFVNDDVRMKQFGTHVGRFVVGNHTSREVTGKQTIAYEMFRRVNGTINTRMKDYIDEFTSRGYENPYDSFD